MNIEISKEANAITIH